MSVRDSKLKKKTYVLLFHCNYKIFNTLQKLFKFNIPVYHPVYSTKTMGDTENIDNSNRNPSVLSTSLSDVDLSFKKQKNDSISVSQLVSESFMLFTGCILHIMHNEIQ